MSHQIENDVENYLIRQIEKLGGLCYKWTAPSVKGVPDRIVLIRGQCIFVELKAPDKKARKLQLYRHKQIQEQGFEVKVLDSKDKVREWVKDL